MRPLSAYSVVRVDPEPRRKLAGDGHDTRLAAFRRLLKPAAPAPRRRPFTFVVNLLRRTA
jgi:hypothetical protein